MQPGPQSEAAWWWQVAAHLDDAQLAMAHAMGYNVDDPRPMQALYERLRESQAILLDIFRMKGLLPPAQAPAQPGAEQHGQVPAPAPPETQPAGTPSAPQPPDASAVDSDGGHTVEVTAAPAANGAAEHHASDAPAQASNGASKQSDETEKNGHRSEAGHPAEPEDAEEVRADAADAHAAEPDLRTESVPSGPPSPPGDKHLHRNQKKKTRPNPGDAGGSSG